MTSVAEGTQVPRPVYVNCLLTPLALTVNRLVPPSSLLRITPAATRALDADLIDTEGLPHCPSAVPDSQACADTMAFQTAPGLNCPPGPSAGQAATELMAKVTSMFGRGLPNRSSVPMLNTSAVWPGQPPLTGSSLRRRSASMPGSAKAMKGSGVCSLPM